VELCFSAWKREKWGSQRGLEKATGGLTLQLTMSFGHLTQAVSPGTYSKMHKASLTGTGGSAVKFLLSLCL